MATKADITLIKSLADKRAREHHGLFVVEGPKMVAEALASGWRIRRVLGVDEDSGLPAFETVGAKDLERMSSLRTPQGVLAVVEMPQREDKICSANLILALDGIQDPGNLGTIMRTADWFGIRRILCSPDTADCFGPKVVQASMGAVFRVSCTYGDLTEIIPQGVPVYGAMLDGENIHTASLSPTGVIVMGSEGGGVSPAVAARIDRRLHIPPFPAGAHTSESLNVASATAIICSEFRRR